jgi:hypothetical protein
MTEVNLARHVKRILDSSSDPVKDLRGFFVEQYNKAHLEDLDHTNLTEHEELEVQKWLIRDSDVPFLSAYLDQVFTRTIFYNEEDKLHYIQQTQNCCRICGGSNEIRYFPIQISPKSHQSITSRLKNYYQKEIRNHPFVRNSTPMSSDNVCLQLTCVLTGLFHSYLGRDMLASSSR